MKKFDEMTKEEIDRRFRRRMAVFLLFLFLIGEWPGVQHAIQKKPHIEAALDISMLPSDMQQKVDECHDQGMKTSNVFDNGQLIGINCYRE